MAAVYIFLIVTILLLFTCMVLSAISSNAVSNKKYDDAHKYSMITAVMSGISAMLVIIVTIIYATRKT